MKQMTTAAPQAILSSALYGKWMESHTGTEDDFLRFLTVPSADRELFLSSLDPDIDASEGLATVTYSA